MGKSEGMWHEARKQERKIRVMMVDYKRRADRRRQYYERIKQDPTQFLRVYGRPSRIHYETNIAAAAENPKNMMPWQGDQSIIIDRFDVRSHLDFYTEYKSKNNPVQITDEEKEEERNANYERYRILVQNECAGVSEEMCLKQIHIDELYGALESKTEEEKKHRLADKKAAIAYTYEDSTDTGKKDYRRPGPKEEEESEDSDLEEMDLDNTVDIYNITTEQAEILNITATHYGMEKQDYCDNLELDKNEAEALKMARLLEEEKAQFSGRRSRRERRAFKEKRLKDHTNDLPSYAALDVPQKKSEPVKKRATSSSRSRSRSPDKPDQFSFISSFGGEGDEGVVQGPTLPPHLLPQSVRNKIAPLPRKRSRSRSTSRGRGGRLPTKTTSRLGHLKALRDRCTSRSSSRSRSRSRSRSPRRRSRSRSRGRRRSRFGSSRSRSRSGRRYSRHSYSRSRSRGRRSSRSRSYSRSRSRSRRSYTRSRSYSSRSNSSRSSSRSMSRSPEKPLVVKSYRRPSLSSQSSNSGADSEEEKSPKKPAKRTPKPPAPSYKLPGKKESFTSKSGSRLSAAEKMKLRMQKALKKQYRADVQERQAREEKSLQERQDREDELRAIAIQLRRRDRERRHKDIGSDSDTGSGSSRSRSRSRSPPPPPQPTAPPPKRYRSRSRSPQRHEPRHEPRRSEYAGRCGRHDDGWRRERDPRDREHGYTSSRPRPGDQVPREARGPVDTRDRGDWRGGPADDRRSAFDYKRMPEPSRDAHRRRIVDY